MIQANELRLGNVIYLQNKPIKVNIDTLNRILNPEYSGNIKFKDQYKPIELTEEILLKCKNIEQKEGSLGIYYFIKPYENLRFFFDGTQLVTIKKDKGNIWIANKTYLHSFQNLFFELTGEELEIDL